MFPTKCNKIKKKLLEGELPLETSLNLLWEEEQPVWKSFGHLLELLKQQAPQKIEETAKYLCQYFPLKKEPFEWLAYATSSPEEKQAYSTLAQRKTLLQSRESAPPPPPTFFLDSSDLFKRSPHLKSHSLLQAFLETDEFLPSRLFHEMIEDPLIPSCLTSLLAHYNDYTLRHRSWPLIHSVTLLGYLRYEAACGSLLSLLEHSDLFLVEEAKNALYWIVLEHSESLLPQLMEQFNQLPHGTLKLQVLDLLTHFGEHEECYPFLHQLLLHFKKNSDAKYSTQYAHLLIQRLVFLADGASLPFARSFFEKNRSWFTDHSLEKLFEVIAQMEGKSS
jgi:hypothetical protein